MHPDKVTAIEWAKQFLRDRNFVLLDTETTDLGNDAEVVQITLLDPDGNVLIDTLVKPTKAISPEATAIHHITDEMVADAPTFASLYADIVQIVENKVVIIYNAAFDNRILRQTCARYGLVELRYTHHCAMLSYAMFVGQWTSRGWKWQKLPAGDHSSRGDCLAMLKIIEQMAATPLE